MKKLALVTTLLLGLSPFALAQSSVNTMNEGQLKEKLQQQGYTNVTLQPIAGRSLSGTSAPSGSAATGTTTGSGSSSPPVNLLNQQNVYQGTGMKDGKQVRFEIDASGRITPQQ